MLLHDFMNIHGGQPNRRRSGGRENRRRPGIWPLGWIKRRRQAAILDLHYAPNGGQRRSQAQAGPAAGPGQNTVAR